MKCRCVHRVLWFIVCPWCKSEAEERFYSREMEERDQCRGVFWRNLSPEQARAEAENEIKIASIRKLRRMRETLF